MGTPHVRSQQPPWLTSSCLVIWASSSTNYLFMNMNKLRSVECKSHISIWASDISQNFCLHKEICFRYTVLEKMSVWTALMVVSVVSLPPSIKVQMCMQRSATLQLCALSYIMFLFWHMKPACGDISAGTVTAIITVISAHGYQNTWYQLSFKKWMVGSALVAKWLQHMWPLQHRWFDSRHVPSYLYPCCPIKVKNAKKEKKARARSSWLVLEIIVLQKNLITRSVYWKKRLNEHQKNKPNHLFMNIRTKPVMALTQTVTLICIYFLQFRFIYSCTHSAVQVSPWRMTK